VEEKKKLKTKSTTYLKILTTMYDVLVHVFLPIKQ